MHRSREQVSIVIPIFNEEDGIALLEEKLVKLQALLGAEFDVEFIFVDDGSSDQTVDRLERHFTPLPLRFQIIEHDVNRGVGAAFRSGFAAARGLIVCTMDADCSYAPEGLLSLLTALRESGADIAIASPYHPQGGVEGIPFWRLALSRTCSGLYRRLSPLKLYTYTSIFRAYRAEVVHNTSFHANGFVSAAEILIAAGRSGYKVVEVPMILRTRTVGRSKMKILRTIGSHLRLLARMVPSTRDAELIPPPSEREGGTADGVLAKTVESSERLGGG